MRMLGESIWQHQIVCRDVRYILALDHFQESVQRTSQPEVPFVGVELGEPRVGGEKSLDHRRCVVAGGIVRDQYAGRGDRLGTDAVQALANERRMLVADDGDGCSAVPTPVCPRS